MYRVEVMDLKKLDPSHGSMGDEAFLARYEVDRRSIWVTGFCRSMNERQLTALFSEIGFVVHILACAEVDCVLSALADQPTPCTLLSWLLGLFGFWYGVRNLPLLCNNICSFL